MTIEIMSAITILSVICSIFFGYKAFSRNKTQDDKMDATQITTVIVKLDNIEATVNEIKSDNQTFKTDLREVREKNIRLEARIDKLEDKITSIEDIVYQDIPHRIKE